ncbi:MAG: Quinolinate synthase A [Promethearchaeota archaeon]|nr:MAG: Quinolinate synthase A [Candidatus Lokiarchaeota archaeon]
MSLKKLKEDILRLKGEKDVTILAHYYQDLEIQEIADFLGDSLGLSRTAKTKADTEYIIFAGVNFMAETASILNPEKHILMPADNACCPMAAFLTQEKIKRFKEEYPNLPAITYVNSTAAVKAESDICCTSSNSIDITRKITKEFEVDSALFGPDANLADYVEQNSGINLIKMPEEGQCSVHSDLTINDLHSVKKEHENAKILVHPECVRKVRKYADFVGSTAQMYNFVKESPSNMNEFIIGTEYGLLERLATDFPEKKFYEPGNRMTCENMKKNTLEMIKYLLENLDDNRYEIKVPSAIAERALKPIEKMLDYS